MKGDKERFLLAGMNGYIPKPLKKEDIRKALYSLLLSNNGGSDFG